MAKVLIEQVDGRVQFTFTESSHYQYNGTADWPLNSLSMTIDSSDMVTFKNQAGDIVYSILLTDLEKTKAEMEELYADVFVGGSGGGITPEEVEEMIDETVDPLVEAIDEKEEVVARALTDLHENKLDVSAYTPTDLSQYWTSAQTEAAITTATSGKQNTLTAGSGISISSDTISCTYPIYVNQYDGRGDITFGKQIDGINGDYYRLAIGQRIRSRGSSNFEGSIGIGLATGNSGQYNQLYGSDSIGIGRYFNIGNDSLNSNTVSGAIAIGANTIVRNSRGLAIGTNTTVSGTTKTNINNQITVDTNNQVYVKDKTNTNDICLQDYLQVKVVKCTQAEYDALVQAGTVDANTLYVITNVV